MEKENKLKQIYKKEVIKYSLLLIISSLILAYPYLIPIERKYSIYSYFLGQLLIISHFVYYKIKNWGISRKIKQFNKNNKLKPKKKKIKFDDITNSLYSLVSYASITFFLLILILPFILAINLFPYMNYANIILGIFIFWIILRLVKNTYNLVFEYPSLIQKILLIKRKVTQFIKKINKSINKFNIPTYLFIVLGIVLSFIIIINKPIEISQNANIISTLITINATVFTLIFTISLAIIPLSKYSKSEKIYTGYNLIYMVSFLLLIIFQITYAYLDINNATIYSIFVALTIFLLLLIVPYFINLNYLISPRKIIDDLYRLCSEEIEEKRLVYRITTSTTLSFKRGLGLKRTSKIDKKNKDFFDCLKRIRQMALLAYNNNDDLTFNYCIETLFKINRDIVYLYKQEHKNASIATLNEIYFITNEINRESFFFSEVLEEFHIDIIQEDEPEELLILDELRTGILGEISKLCETDKEISTIIPLLLSIITRRVYYSNVTNVILHKGEKTINIGEYYGNYKESKYTDIIINLAKKNKNLVLNIINNQKEAYLRVGDERTKQIIPQMMDYIISKIS